MKNLKSMKNDKNRRGRGYEAMGELIRMQAYNCVCEWVPRSKR